MPNLPFTLRQLDVFASLCTTRSFRGSADSLGVSQASISNQIKALEDQLGVKLLARSPGKRPSLTAEGRAFLEDLRRFEAAGKALAAHRRCVPQTAAPVRFRLLVGQGLWDNFIRPKLDHFLVDHPQINLDFDAQPPEDRISHVLDEGLYDFALLHLRARFPMDRQIRSMALLRGGIYGHRDFAAGRPTPLDAETVSQLPFILPRPGATIERETLRSLERYGIRPRNVVSHTQYYDVIAAMLDRGAAVASFTEALIPSAMREHIIQLYPLEDWRLVWFRKDHGNDSTCNIVEEFLIRSVLLDANYPPIEIHDPKYLDYSSFHHIVE